MLPIRIKSFRWPLLLSGILAACLLPTAPATAQDTGNDGSAGSSYRTRENTPAPGAEQGAPDQTTSLPGTTDHSAQGPVRLARFAYVLGKVTWRADDSMEWSPATVNLPIRQGAQIWVTEGGRADIQFDDGSELRLGNGALATLKLLYSDAQGEFTQITLNDGLATLYARHDVSVYQVDTPITSVKTKGPSQIRFGVDRGSEVAVQRGGATLEGRPGKATLNQGDYLYLTDADAPYNVRSLPAEDGWDRWNAERDGQIEAKTETSRHVPPDIGLVSGDLDVYGTWRDDPRYGWVWHPRVTESDWRPYYNGHWVWVDPFGWTWVGEEPWGWAPYHYGTWIDEPYGWAWVPGPAVQYWCPAVVSFASYGGDIAWAPLCPWEVHYPAAFSLGLFGPNWAFDFSIGCAGVYYPWTGGFCLGLGFDTFYVNHFGDFDHHHHFGGFDGDHHFFNHNGWMGDHHFIPYNASHAAGTTIAGMTAFGGRGNYRPAPRADTSFFTRGRLAAAPAKGYAPISGPASIHPTSLAMTPTRSFTPSVHPPQTALQRSSYHAPASVAAGRNLNAGPAGRTPARIASASTDRTPFHSGTERTAPSSGGSASEAARQARSSLGMSGERGRTESAMQRRPEESMAGRTHPAFENRSGSAAEAAREARASLGASGREPGAGFSRGSGSSSSERYNGSMRSGGGYGERTTGGSEYGGWYGGRSYSAGPGSWSSGSAGWRHGEMYGPPNTYRSGASGGSYYGNFGGGRSYGGSGYSPGRSGGYSGGSSGGGRSYGGGSFGGGRSNGRDRGR